MVDYRVETFLLLCQLMNYRKTAEVLGITQPAVTQHIHFLENKYNCKLFIYQKSKLIKTNAAVILERYARALQVQDIHLRNKIKGEKRELRIGATKTIGDYVLKEHVRQYLAHEENSLNLVVDNTEHLLRMLDNSQLDFAVIEGYFDRMLYGSQLFRKEHYVGICPIDHPFSGREVSMDELYQEAIICREDGSGTRAILEQKLRSCNGSLDQFRRMICISSFPMILDLVKHGFGISFVYEVLADSDLSLAKFEIKGESIGWEFNIVYPKYADIQEKIKWFFPEMECL